MEPLYLVTAPGHPPQTMTAWDAWRNAVWLASSGLPLFSIEPIDCGSVVPWTEHPTTTLQPYSQSTR